MINYDSRSMSAHSVTSGSASVCHGSTSSSDRVHEMIGRLQERHCILSERITNLLGAIEPILIQSPPPPSCGVDPIAVRAGRCLVADQLADLETSFLQMTSQVNDAIARIAL